LLHRFFDREDGLKRRAAPTQFLEQRGQHRRLKVMRG
jgi:hypothetical protein